MSISHNDIPNTLRSHIVTIEFDNSGAVTGTPAPLGKTLMIAFGSKTDEQSAAQDTDGSAPFNEISRAWNYLTAASCFGEGNGAGYG